MRGKAFERIIKGEPVNLEERLENLEKITELKLRQFEDTLLLFRDVVMRLYEEKEELRRENDSLKSKITGNIAEAKEIVKSGAERAIAPIKSAADDFIELAFEPEPEASPKPLQIPAEAKASHISSDILRQSDEMERTVKWMRERFGLPPHQLSKKKKKVRA
jgi:hypothetical protein